MEVVDTTDLKSVSRKGVGVRVPWPAPLLLVLLLAGCIQSDNLLSNLMNMQELMDVERITERLSLKPYIYRYDNGKVMEVVDEKIVYSWEI